MAPGSSTNSARAMTMNDDWINTRQLATLAARGLETYDKGLPRWGKRGREGSISTRRSSYDANDLAASLFDNTLPSSYILEYGGGGLPTLHMTPPGLLASLSSFAFLFHLLSPVFRGCVTPCLHTRSFPIFQTHPFFIIRFQSLLPRKSLQVSSSHGVVEEISDML